MPKRFTYRGSPRCFLVRFLLILPLILCVSVTYAAAETSSPPDAAVERVDDLGIIESAPFILGRDGGYSALFQNHSVWIFGDTVIRRDAHAAPALVSNSCASTTDRTAADGISGFQPCRDSPGLTREIMPFTLEEQSFNRDHDINNCKAEPCGARWALWPGALIDDTVHNRLLLFYKKVLVKPGLLNFQTAGHSMAAWRRLGEPLERISQLMFGQNEPAYGSAAVTLNAMLYIFGCSLDGTSKPCRLARVPLARATDRTAWEFYGVSQKWQKDIDGSKVILDGNDMMSVSFNSYLNRYLAIYSQPMSTAVVLRTAKTIEGPWSRPLKAFDAIAPLNDIGWIYDALEHPEYAGENGRVIYITYSRQTGPLTFEMRLVALTLRKM